MADYFAVCLLITWGKKRKQQKYEICLREDEIQLFSNSEQKPSKELKTMAEERGAGEGANVDDESVGRLIFISSED